MSLTSDMLFKRIKLFGQESHFTFLLFFFPGIAYFNSIGFFGLGLFHQCVDAAGYFFPGGYVLLKREVSSLVSFTTCACLM